ncbi:MFS/sugar transport protein [Desulfofustis glycolicus DSM 9705]|uniref:MFS/sugar transport protein n=1 Tax=Desulfofustis glycolicus DSM 9705 TaxID=1121409 RepID=A0A1M5YRM3_9BACT|nr:MFS/sugar transport protein [Desulfofustis glycolicus DSM 9705]
MLFTPDPDNGIGYLLLWAMVIYIAGTMAIIPMNAWGSELSPDYRKRSTITGTRTAFGLAGTMAALLVPAIIGQHGSDDLGTTLQIISWLVIATLAIAGLLLFLVPDDQPTAMNGDLVEWDAASNGYRRPGLLFAVWATFTKLAYALAIGIAFPLLDLFGFAAGADNDPVALTALAYLYGIPCIIFKIMALLNMRNYPITEEAYGKILDRNTGSADTAA